MPKRELRPGIRDSARLVGIHPADRWLYICLVVTVDDFGRYDGRPELVRAACCPLELDTVTLGDIRGGLAALARAGLLELYSIGGKPYLQLCNWRNDPRASKSPWPCPHGKPGKCGECCAAAARYDGALLATAVHAKVNDGRNCGQMAATAGACPQSRAPGRETETETVIEHQRRRENRLVEAQAAPQPWHALALLRSDSAAASQADDDNGDGAGLAAALSDFFGGPQRIPALQAHKASDAVLEYGSDRVCAALRAAKAAGEPFGVALAMARKAGWTAADKAAAPAGPTLGELTRGVMQP